MRETILVNIGDWDSDIYELLELALSQPHNHHLLIRAEQNRQLEDEASHLWDFMARQPVATTIEAHVPPKSKRPERDATLEVRFAPVPIKPPARGGCEATAVAQPPGVGRRSIIPTHPRA